MALPKRPTFGANDTNTKSYRSLPTPNITPVEPEPAYEDEFLYDDTPDDTVVVANDGYGYGEEESVQDGGVFDEEDEDSDDEFNDEIEQELSALSEEVQRSVELLIQEILSDESSEVIMNGPDSIHCKRHGQRIHLTEIDFKDVKTYHNVINKFILQYADTKERISENAQIVEGQLEIEDNYDPDAPPMVARIHIISPPVVKFAKVTIAKKARRQFTLEDIFERDAMNRNMYEFLTAIARGKATTVFSGISGSGKTTLMEAMSYHFDKDDRVIVAEDTPELKFPLPDVVYMVSTRPKPGDPIEKKPISLEWIVAQANRMRPDRIIVGETRGAEMAEFLVAANSGAEGSMTTLHAQSPERTLSKMVNLASKAVENSNRDDLSLLRDIAGTVQIIIQMSLIDDRHIITHITEVSDIVTVQSGKISLTPLFEYDRRARNWKNVGRPSESLKAFFEERNVALQMSWFQK